MAKKIKEKPNKTNPVLWFFFAIVIPFIVAITITVIIFTVAGVDVIGWAKNTGNNIPVVSSVITTDKEKNSQRAEEKMKDTIASKDEEISQLNREVSSLESTVDKLEQENVKLENSNSNENDSKSDTSDKAGTEAGNDSIKTISSSFKDMDSEQAALITENMEQDLAVGILKQVPNDVRGEIFEQMDPGLAAELAQLFVTN